MLWKFLCRCLDKLVAVEEGGAIGVYPLHKEGTACVVSTPLDV